MASSGQVKGNTLSGGDYFFINWQLSDQEIGNNRSLITWQAYWHFDNSDRQLDNGDVEVNGGTEWDNGGRVYNYSGNISTRNLKVASGSRWVNHNSDGSKSFNINGGLTGYVGERSSGSKSFALPTIPRNAEYKSPKPTSMDTSTNLQTGIDNPADGYIRLYLRKSNPGSNGDAWAVRSAGKKDGTFTWNLTDAERDELMAEYPNAKSFVVRMALYTYSNSGYSSQIGDGVGYNLTYTITGYDPIFTDYEIRDGNATTVAITGDDQYFIQGYSTMEVTVPEALKAIAQKYASMSTYRAIVSDISEYYTYVGDADFVQDVGVINTNTNTPFVLRAIDSRNNYTDITKTLNVLPYLTPQITVDAERTNNFEAETTISISAIISRLTVASTDKNSVDATSGVQYRYKATDTETWGSWTNVANSTSGENVTATDVVLTLNNTKSFNVEVKVTDELTTNTVAIVVERGVPVFFIDQEGKVAVNGVPADYSADATEDVANPTKLDVFGAIRQNGVRVREDSLKRLVYTAVGSFSLATSTWKRLVFTTKSSDSLGGYSNSTGIFTAPKAGMYRIWASWRGEEVAGAYRYVFGVGDVSDGSANLQRLRDEVYGGGNIAPMHSGYCEMYLSAGQQVGIYYWHGIGSTRSYSAQSGINYAGLRITYDGNVAPELP